MEHQILRKKFNRTARPGEGRIKAGELVYINLVEFNWKQWCFLWLGDKRTEAVHYIDVSVVIR